jgi:hypothetical protein
MSMEFDRNFLVGRIPIGVDEELFGGPLILVAGEEHLGLDVLAEAVRTGG